MVFRVFKTQLGKLFLFLIFVSVGGLYFVFHKVTMIRDYYKYLVEEEQILHEQMTLLAEFGAQLGREVSQTNDPGTSYIEETEETTEPPQTSKKDTVEVERLREKDHMKLSKVLQSLKSLQERKSHGENCATSEPDWDAIPELPSDTKILIPVLTYGPNNQLRGFRSVR